MDKFKPGAESNAEEWPRFKHCLLQLMPYNLSAPPHMKHLQEKVECILSRRSPRNEKLDAGSALHELLKQQSDVIHRAPTLLIEVLEETVVSCPSPLLYELLAQAHIDELDDQRFEIHFRNVRMLQRDMPSFFRTGRPLELCEVRPPSRAREIWMTSVSALSRAEPEELDALTPEEILASLRILQLNLLFHDPIAAGALTFFEGRGLKLWNDLLDRADYSLGPMDVYDQARQRAFWRHLRGAVELKALGGKQPAKNAEPYAQAYAPTEHSGAGWHTVITGAIPPSSLHEDRDTLARFARLQQPIPVAKLPSDTELDSLEEVLTDEFPWAARAIDELVKDLRTRILFGGVELGTTPTLLVGMPGSGKSRLIRRIAEELRVSFCPLAIAGMIDGLTMTGTARGWSTGQASPLIESMLRNENASMLVSLDEIDKVGASSSRSVPPTVALLSLLEPENSKHWYDTFLQTPCDLSKLMFWATANTLSPLSKPLLSRLRVILVPEPSPVHFGAIARGAVIDIACEWGLPKDTLRELGSAVPVQQVRNAREVQAVARAFLHDWAQTRLGRQRLH